MITAQSYKWSTTSQELFQLNNHYKNHYLIYIDKVNLISENYTWLKGSSIENIIQIARLYGDLYNNAAQVYNHELFFEQFTVTPEYLDITSIKDFLETKELTLEEFKKAIVNKSQELFGSGYLWVYLDEDKTLKIDIGVNAENLVRRKKCVPLIVIDLWEHSYYLKYRERALYVLDVIDNINWSIILDRINNIK